MLLTITTTHLPATALGYLRHKHPERFQSFARFFGRASICYAEAGVRAWHSRPAAGYRCTNADGGI
ncbi:hypothetical protein [Allocoleopsis sp.]|uniref:hypothetical protein n=1 Tax=Allocoleopsis sp. TaxID=3088169 RepID=UPI0039C8952D